MRVLLVARVSASLRLAGALIWLVPAAIAQDLSLRNEYTLPGMIVTGTRIPTLERKSALPVQVITREEIERTNLQTAAQLVNTISATTSYSAFNEAQGLALNGAGSSPPGFAGGALRGLGYQFTVILINGHRVANYAFVARGGDLNAIPLSAVERVEVLKDGASAIYGADAIGGVINFILRRDFEGLEASAQYTSPEHTGGYANRFTATGGIGNLAAEKFNAYATVDYQQFGGIRARDRAFAARSYIPEEGVDRTDPESVPANIVTLEGLRNPSGNPADGYRNPACAPPLSTSSVTAYPGECRWLGDGTTSIVDPSERLNVAGAVTLRLHPDHELYLNGTWARNRFTFTTGATAVSDQTVAGSSGFLLPVTSAFYPQDFATAFGIDGRPLDVFWRAQDLGSRTIEPVAEQLNAVAGMRGAIAGWSYDGAFNYSRSDVDVRYAEGFVRESVLVPILDSGIVNPFGANAQDAVDRMAAAKIDGVLRSGESSLAALDLYAYRELLPLTAGPLVLAVGANAFQERLVNSADPALESGDVLNTTSFGSFSGSRNVWAAFAEANVPLVETLQASVAVRYDHYSDFGSTTNPKIALRWQPMAEVLLRASAGTGFLAPSLAGLSPSQERGFTTVESDPARCPTTASPQDCGRRFPTLGGGNPGLQPVKSHQGSVGGVWAPTRELSLGFDYVRILLDNRINFFLPDAILDQCPDGVTGSTCYLIHRGPIDPTYPGLPGPIIQIDQTLTNLGKKRVSAVDVEMQYALPRQPWGRLAINFSGTWNIEHLEQQVDGSYVDLAGKYSTSGGTPGVIPRWRHYLEVDWSYGAWSATLTENYQSGTYDQPPPLNSGLRQRRIGDYDVWNLGFAYEGLCNWSIAAGIKNLLDRDPPFSAQRQTVQVGYDPSYGDPHGRLYWAGVRYAFH